VLNGIIQKSETNNLKEKKIFLTGDYRKIKTNKDLLRKNENE